MLSCSLVLVLLSPSAEPQASDSEGFVVQSRLVLVPVVVTDKKGIPVETLEPNEFVLTDNGRKQTISVDTFATGVAPVALAIAVQSSGISAPALLKVQKIDDSTAGCR